MSNDIVIRDVEPAEIETIAQMAAVAWEPIYASRRKMVGDDLFAILHTHWREKKADQIREACKADNPTGVCVAVMDERIAGFVTYRTDEKTGIGEIGNNAVDPACQGHGIAGRMYAYVFERMREAGMRYVKVGTGGDAGHAPARRAYEKAGFDRCIPHVEYWQEL